MQTDAIIFTRNEEATIGRREVPPPGEGAMQLRSHYTTISVGTEGWIFRNLFTWSPTPFPCVPGHQHTGLVTGVGPKAGKVFTPAGRRDARRAKEWTRSCTSPQS